MKILRRWYGDRPVVILVDKVEKSKDEALVRQELCRAMDLWGGQVFVVMSALSNYAAAAEMLAIDRSTCTRWHRWVLMPSAFFPKSSANCRTEKERRGKSCTEFLLPGELRATHEPLRR